jgi:hypothetical protein
MDASNQQETEPLITASGIHVAVPDTHETSKKKRALYFILACTLFERIAFYALMNILFTTLQLPELFHWDSHHSETALFIFSGK